MATVYKVKEHNPAGEGFIYHQTSADIVDFDPSNAVGMDDTNMQGAMETLNEKVENRVTYEQLSATVDDLNQSILDVDKKVDSNALTKTYRATIYADAFEGTTAPYTQKIYIDGILEPDNPIIGLIVSESVMSALDQRDSWGCITKIKSHDGYLMVYCFESKPSVDLDIQIKIIR